MTYRIGTGGEAISAYGDQWSLEFNIQAQAKPMLKTLISLKGCQLWAGKFQEVWEGVGV